MKMRTRFTLWFAGVLFLALLAMGLLTYWELVIEPRSTAIPPTLEIKEYALTEILEFLGWCGLAPLVLALLGGWWLIRKGLEPVEALTPAAEQLNEHNLHQRLARTGKGDELDRLTEVFNNMSGRLQQSFLRLHEFTLHASHELKTPLTVLHAELEVVLQNDKLDPAQRKSVESQIDEIQRLTKIVDGLTLLTKAEAGQVQLARAELPLEELVQEALSDAQSLARPQGIEVTLADSDPATVVGDRHRLRQLLLNLCDNAIKYNHPGGKVTLTLEAANGMATLTVSNTGPGFPPELAVRIFDPFFRGDASHSKTVDGCGLGLSIARWVTQAHGGTIYATSDPGGWTRFTVKLPLASHPSEIASAATANSQATQSSDPISLPGNRLQGSRVMF